MNIIITAIGGHDRPGIIAALTKVVFDVGGNLDDVTMTRLRGAFTNMLAATLPAGGTLEGVRERLAPVAAELGLHVDVYEIADDLDEGELEPDHLISVYGADHPGIVHRITSLLADHAANITDLNTRVAGTEERPVYVMLIQTAGGDWDVLPAKLTSTAASLGVDVTVHDIDAEAL